MAVTANTTSVPNTTAPYLSRTAVTPQIITGYLIRVLQWKFSDPKNHVNDALKNANYLWSPNDTENETITTKILIETSLNFNPAQANQNPAIIVARNSLEPIKTVIGNHYTHPSGLVGKANAKSGTNATDSNNYATIGHDQYLYTFRGSHSIYAIHTTGASADILAYDVWITLIHLSKLIRRDLGLNEFQVEGIQRTGKLEENDSCWITPFLVTYSYNYSFTVHQESPLLKAFSLINNLSQ
jgi:hypothetical protein